MVRTGPSQRYSHFGLASALATARLAQQTLHELDQFSLHGPRLSLQAGGQRAESPDGAILRTRRVEHVIFSGDATAMGFDEEIRRAAELLEVNRRPGWRCRAITTIAPGLPRVPAASNAISLPGRPASALDAVYPFAQQVGPAWLVAVNSVTGNVSPWDASGAVGREQCARLEQLLAQLSPGPRLLVTHYPICLANGRAENRYHRLHDLARRCADREQGQCERLAARPSPHAVCIATGRICAVSGHLLRQRHADGALDLF